MKDLIHAQIYPCPVGRRICQSGVDRQESILYARRWRSEEMAASKEKEQKEEKEEE